MANELAQLDAIETALVQAVDIHDVLRGYNAIITVSGIAQRMGMRRDEQNRIGEFVVRWAHLGGTMLREMEMARGGWPSCGSAVEPQDTAPTLSDHGITKTQSHRWQQIAKLSLEQLNAYIEKAKGSENEFVTATGVYKCAGKKNGKSHGPPGNDICVVADLKQLVDSGERFGVIYADPPWKYENQGTRASTGEHYETLSASEVAEFPHIPALAAEDAHLHLWTTNAFLFEAKSVIEAWGFVYKSCFVWVKPQMGIGNYWRVSHEFLLLGVKGKPAWVDKGIKSWGEYDRTRHSRKPPQVPALIEKTNPGPYFEAFGREGRPGWTVWGNQVERSQMALPL